MPKTASHRRWMGMFVPLHNGARLHVRYWPGHGHPVVLLHGFLDSAAGWDSYCQVTHRPCYAIDLPGFGRSRWGKAKPRHDESSLERYAEAVAEALEQLCLSEFTLVGHSLGGGVASLVADRLAQRVDSLVLVAPAGFGRIPLAEFADRRGVREVVEVLLRLGLVNPLAIDVAYALQVSGGKHIPLKLLARLLTHSASITDAAKVGAAALARMSRQGGVQVKPGVFKGAVAALWGDRDKLVPRKHAVRVKEMYPQAHVEIWGGMAHHPQVERPQQLNRFIERCAARGRQVRRRRRWERRKHTWEAVARRQHLQAA